MKNPSLKKLSRNGNSLSIVIEKPLLEILGATPESFIKRTVEGNKLILEFVSPEERQQLVKEISSSVIKTHGETFKKLAKS